MPQLQPVAAGSCPALEEAIIALPDLRPFPETATRLLSACQSDVSSSQSIAEIVKHDPGIAVKLLRIANSSMYGQVGRVRTIEQAVVVLGFRCVSDLAVAMAGQNLINAGDTAASERRNLWKHSLACAVIARSLAIESTQIRPEEAFLAGIFHDIGKLLFYDVVPDEYRSAISGVDLADVLHSERKAFGMTHESVGVTCAEHWGLSSAIRSAIGFHHRPHRVRQDSMLVLVTATANVLTRVWELGCTATDAPLQVVPDWVSQLGLDDEDLDGISGRVEGEFHEALELCTLT